MINVFTLFREQKERKKEAYLVGLPSNFSLGINEK